MTENWNLFRGMALYQLGMKKNKVRFSILQHAEVCNIHYEGIQRDKARASQAAGIRTMCSGVDTLS